MVTSSGWGRKTGLGGTGAGGVSNRADDLTGSNHLLAAAAEVRLASVTAGDSVRSFIRIRRALRPHGNRFGHELVHQLVETGLPAEMLRVRALPVARVPAADAQLSCLLISDKPVVGLPSSPMRRCRTMIACRITSNPLAPWQICPVRCLDVPPSISSCGGRNE